MSHPPAKDYHLQILQMARVADIDSQIKRYSGSEVTGKSLQ